MHGVGEAAHLYFGKPASRLSVAESGLIAAIIQSPNGISPYRDPERALRRRNLVLELMMEQGRLDPETFAQAREEPLRLATVTPEPGDARFFLDFLHRQLTDTYTAEQLTEEGLRIYSTLDRRLQRIAAQALDEGLRQIEKLRPEARERRSRASAPGLSRGDPAADRRGARARRGPRLPHLAVRPLHPGAAPGRQRVQAVRLHRGARAARRRCP